jgi:hypothetical protein
MARVARRIVEILIYFVMLILVLMYFKGEGVFIYEGF